MYICIYGEVTLANKLTISNKCPFCNTLYAARRVAIAHVAKSLLKKSCPKTRQRGSGLFHAHNTSPPYECKFCNITFHDVEEAQAHIEGQHLPSDILVP